MLPCTEYISVTMVQQKFISSQSIITTTLIEAAKKRLQDIIIETPLQLNRSLSEKYDCEVWLKREDLQVVRSYKIRGAYNKICQLPPTVQAKGIVCASAGNHAQGVALACALLKIKGIIFMPRTTPRQKVEKVRDFGGPWIEIKLRGDSFDDAAAEATKFVNLHQMSFIPPFDDLDIIAGQGTVGLEILQQCPQSIDYIFAGIGGGGLISGLGSYFKILNPKTKIIGVEPSGAAAMQAALQSGQRVTLSKLDTFVDGAAVRTVGHLNFKICQKVVDEISLVPEGKVCTTILELYNQEAMVVEPAGALSIAVLDEYRQTIKGKRIVCVVSGGNNDITRTEEIKERSMLYEGKKHYFIVRFPQRAGALREFLVEVLGTKNDITHFEYIKKNSREKGPALVGIETPSKLAYHDLLLRMQEHQVDFELLNNNPSLFQLLI
ncbi:MAG: threonine ammonia-lyase IlvA [Saprospiraceae bacterium]